MKILIVDDHPIVLQSINLTLRASDCQTMLAHDHESAKNALQQPFDCLLLDYRLAEACGMDLLVLPDVVLPDHILIFSGMSNPEEIIFALETSAAHAFISKQIDLADLYGAIAQSKDLDHEKKWVWNNARQHFVVAAEAFPGQTLLTGKERGVYLLLLQGLAIKEIADRLNGNIHDIRVQIRGIKRKRKTIPRAV